MMMTSWYGIAFLYYCEENPMATGGFPHIGLVVQTAGYVNNDQRKVHSKNPWRSSVHMHTKVIVTGEFDSIVTTSSNGNVFRVTDPLWGESTGDMWISLTNAGDAELWCFLGSAPEQTLDNRDDAD